MKQLTIFTTILLMTINISCLRATNNPKQPLDTMNDKNMLAIESFRLEINTMMANEFVYAGQKTDKGFHLEYFLSSKHWDDSLGDYAEEKYIVHAIDGDQQFYEEVCQLMTTCNINKWDGFHGENPPGLLDGSTMSFDAKLCDGTTIHAHGSNNFPKGYGTLEDGLSVLSTCERITSKNFATELFSITLPEKWVNLVTVEFRECYIAFKLPQADGKKMTMLLIDESTYDYYNSSYEPSVNIGKLVDAKDEGTTHYIDFRDYYGLKSYSDKLTEEAKALLDTYETDKQGIIDSFKPADGYQFIKEE